MGRNDAGRNGAGRARRAPPYKSTRQVIVSQVEAGPGQNTRLLSKTNILRWKPHTMRILQNIRPVKLGDPKIAGLPKRVVYLLKRYAANATARVIVYPRRTGADPGIAGVRN